MVVFFRRVVFLVADVATDDRDVPGLDLVLASGVVLLVLFLACGGGEDAAPATPVDTAGVDEPQPIWFSTFKTKGVWKILHFYAKFYKFVFLHSSLIKSAR